MGEGKVRGRSPALFPLAISMYYAKLAFMGVDKEILGEIINLIVRYKKPEKIILFGSRANNDFKKTSDIDIAIFGREWTSRDIDTVRHNLDESIKTPLKFDVLNFYDITKDTLKKNILEKGKIIYE